MGIHDFDLGRMFMGEVATVHAVGGALAYPEMKSVGDIDNAFVNLVFESGALGTVQLSRNAVFGYDIRTEIWGTKGSLQIGYSQHTPILVMTAGGHHARRRAAFHAALRERLPVVNTSSCPVLFTRDLSAL